MHSTVREQVNSAVKFWKCLGPQERRKEWKRSTEKELEMK